MPRFRWPALLMLLCLVTPLGAMAEDRVRLRLFDGEVIDLPLAMPGRALSDPDYQARSEPDLTITVWVPRGESVEDWSNMQTLLGYGNLAEDPGARAPEDLLQALRVHFLTLYIEGCAAEAFAAPLTLEQQNGPVMAATFVGCSDLRDSPGSEAMAFVVILGDRNAYVLQWSERGAQRAPFGPDDTAYWQNRVEHLLPIRLCTVPEGEDPPYPSCT